MFRSLAKKLMACLVVFVAVSPLAMAATGDRSNLTIEQIHPMSQERLTCAACSGVTRIYVTRGDWGDTGCRADAADIYSNDEHLMSVVLTAWAMGKTIRIEVNNEHPTLHGVCRATALFVK